MGWEGEGLCSNSALMEAGAGCIKGVARACPTTTLTSPRLGPPTGPGALRAAPRRLGRGPDGEPHCRLPLPLHHRRHRRRRAGTPRAETLVETTGDATTRGVMTGGAGMTGAGAVETTATGPGTTADQPCPSRPCTPRRCPQCPCPRPRPRRAGRARSPGRPSTAPRRRLSTRPGRHRRGCTWT